MKELQKILPLVTQIAQDAKELQKKHASKTGSAHSKFETIKAYNETSTSLVDLKNLWLSYMPSHWEMNGWNFYLSKNGETIKWTIDGNKYTKGLKFYSTQTGILFATAYILGVTEIANGQAYKKDTSRLADIDIDTTSIKPFMYQERLDNENKYLTSYGKTPTEAWAKLLAQGITSSYTENMLGSTNTPLNDEDAKLIYNNGFKKGKHVASKTGRNWSCSRIILERLHNNPKFAKLSRLNQTLKNNKDTRSCWGFFNFEKALFSISKNIELLTNPKKINSYIIKEYSSNNVVLVKAWDEDSAVAGLHITP